MKWPFSRKGDQTSVPAEIQEYYQSERRERTGVAWLLALGTLLVTIALAILLFFGGRWLYRTVTNRDDNKSGQTTEQAVQDQATETPPSDNNKDTGSGGDTPAPATTPSTPATPTPTTQPTTPATGPLPNTGAGDVIGIFVATTLAGAVAHRAIHGRRFES